MTEDSAPQQYRVETLPEIPALGPLYFKGAAASGRIGLKRVAAMQELPGIPGLYSAPHQPEAGRRFELPPVVYRVEGVRTRDLAGHLRDYQQLVHEPGSDALPSGYLHVLAFPLATAVMTRPDFPLPLLGMVHLKNDASLLEPVRLGDVLDVRAWAENLRPHAKGAQVDVVAEVWIERPDGPHLAWRGVSTYLAKGVSLEPITLAESMGDPLVEALETSEPGPKPTRTPPYPTGRWDLTPDTGRSYAAISGDRNPIHLSSLSAKAFGFPKAIAHGMYTAARALAEAGPTRGDTYRWTVEFAKPVLLPSSVDVAITPRGEGDGYDYVGWNAKKGSRHFTGTVTPI